MAYFFLRHFNALLCIFKRLRYFFRVHVEYKLKLADHGEVGEDSFSGHDAETVMRRLGLWNSSEVESGGLLVMDGANRLLEEKEASLEELEEAFEVFDENGNGVISAEEVRSVMQMLGFEEGREVEECRRMIEAYDGDGDGALTFSEFKKMLTSAL
ncbi:calmodulin-like protein 7 [Canna indica]|uniref:Calmodulin-like protein 7 n=1 Tax=Canna indica TaxID=4628 RepID=A0AAQ3Q287_9LILI|nr:calmodulin-like protein 7 [Canna indica]